VTPLTLLIILLACLFVGLALGFPMAFTLGSSAIVVGFIYGGTRVLTIAAMQVYSGMVSLSLVAMPLFIFIACLLEKSGLAEELYAAIRHWLAAVPGGLAIATVVVCTVIAAMSGVAAAGVITMGVIALPIMLRYKYDKSIALAPIMAGGALGILIPPSVTAIIFGMLTHTSIGRLFAGGLIPGVILSAAYMTYIGLRCHFRPSLGPVVPPEDRLPFRQKLALSRGVIIPIVIIVIMLGSIFLGIASPMESAAVGAVAILVSIAIRRKLSWQLFKEACYRTFVINCIIMWIIFGAKIFATIFIDIGTAQLVRGVLTDLTVSPIMLVVFMQLSYILLGCIVEEITMITLTIPVYAPILMAFGFDPVWFGVLFIINMQLGYLTPPFGYCLFYMRGVAPPGVTITDIYRSIWPFLIIQASVLVLVLLFPQLALWLPETVFALG